MERERESKLGEQENTSREGGTLFWGMTETGTL